MPSLLYQTRRKNPLIYKGLNYQKANITTKASFSHDTAHIIMKMVLYRSLLLSIHTTIKRITIKIFKVIKFLHRVSSISVEIIVKCA